MSDQQAKYGTVPSETSKTAQGSPGEYEPHPASEEVTKEPAAEATTRKFYRRDEQRHGGLC